MSGETQSGNRPLVLVAEDDADLMRIVSSVIGTVADVVGCHDGMDAYVYLRSDKPRPHLLVTDIMMPRLDGMALLARMQTDPQLAPIPVILLTAKGAATDVIAGINTGARFYITKPFKQEDLLAKVKKVLGV